VPDFKYSRDHRRRKMVELRNDGDKVEGAVDGAE